MQATEQDRLLVSLLTPSRLLEFLRGYVLFDRKVGKIVARYQQFFGIRALLSRISRKKPDSQGGGREGWCCLAHHGLRQELHHGVLDQGPAAGRKPQECRIVVVTDRVDLETQLSRNFMTGGAFGSSIAMQRDGERSRTCPVVTWPAHRRGPNGITSPSSTSSTRRPSCRVPQRLGGR